MQEIDARSNEEFSLSGDYYHLWTVRGSVGGGGSVHFARRNVCKGVASVGVSLG